MNANTSQTHTICFMFPGQLLELPAIANDILVDKAITEHRVIAAREITGFEWQGLYFHDPEFNQHINLRLQLTSYLISLMYYDYLMRSGIIPDVICEHSMGIYAALVASGAFTFEEGLELVFKIGLLIENKTKHMNGAMASIIGLTEQDILLIFKRLRQHRLFIANYNGSKQFVLSGDEDGIEQTIEIALHEYQAVAARKLLFSAPMHSSLLESIKNDLRDILSRFSPRELRIPVVNHLTAEFCCRDEIMQLLCEEIYRPVFWEKCVHRMKKYGVNLFIETGYGETLQKLIRWIDPDLLVVNIRDKGSIEKVRKLL